MVDSERETPDELSCSWVSFLDSSLSGLICLKTLPDASSLYDMVYPSTGALSSAALYLNDMWHLNRTVAIIVLTVETEFTPNSTASAGVFAYGALFSGSTH